METWVPPLPGARAGRSLLERMGDPGLIWSPGRRLSLLF